LFLSKALVFSVKSFFYLFNSFLSVNKAFLLSCKAFISVLVDLTKSLLLLLDNAFVSILSKADPIVSKPDLPSILEAS
jgi:hypothetical protein